MPYLITSVYSLLQVVDIFLDNLAYDCGFFSIGMGSKKKKNETARQDSNSGWLGCTTVTLPLGLRLVLTTVEITE
jgi:hypothetical protein